MGNTNRNTQFVSPKVISSPVKEEEQVWVEEVGLPLDLSASNSEHPSRWQEWMAKALSDVTSHVYLRVDTRLMSNISVEKVGDLVSQFSNVHVILVKVSSSVDTLWQGLALHRTGMQTLWVQSCLNTRLDVVCTPALLQAAQNAFRLDLRLAVTERRPRYKSSSRRQTVINDVDSFPSLIRDLGAQQANPMKLQHIWFYVWPWMINAMKRLVPSTADVLSGLKARDENIGASLSTTLPNGVEIRLSLVDDDNPW